MNAARAPVPAGQMLMSGIGAVTQTLAAKMGLLVLNLATGVIVARALAPVGRGEQAAMAMWPGLLCGLFSFGLGLSVTYNIRRDPGRTADYFQTSAVLAIVFGLAAMAIGYAFIPLWIHQYNAHVIAFARLMMLLVPFTMLTYVLQGLLESRGDFTASNLSKFLPQVGCVAVLAVLALTHRLTPFTSTAGYLLPWIAVPPLLAWRARDAISLRISAFGDVAKRLLSYGSRTYIIDILGTLSGQVDQVLVVGLISASGLGLYTVALSVSRVLTVFHASLVTVIFPKASALETTDVVTLTGRAVRISTLVSGLAALSLGALLPFILVRLYGGAFAGVVPVARVLCAEVVLTGGVAILSQAFMATGRPGTVAILQLIGLALTVPYMLLLIPHFGLVGAAVALLLSSLSRLLLVLAAYPIVLHAPVPSLIMRRSDFAYLISRLGFLRRLRRRAS